MARSVGGGGVMLTESGQLSRSPRTVDSVQALDDGRLDDAYVLELAAWPDASLTFPEPRPNPPGPGFFRLVDTRPVA